MQFCKLLGRERAPTEPMFLARDGVRPYTYGCISTDFQTRRDAVGGTRGTLHGLCVLGYNRSRQANGTDLTVAHGGWFSEGHSRYARFAQLAVLGIPAGMVEATSVFGSTASVRPVARGVTERGAVTASTSTAAAAVATAPSAGDGSGYDGSSSEGDVDLSAEPLVDGDLAPSGQAASAADPPGYVREEHTSAPGGRVYSVWLAPTGERFRSRRLAWAHAMLRGPRAGAGTSPVSAVLSPACLDCDSDGGGSDGSDGAGAPSPPPASARAVTRGAQRASTAPRPPRSRHSFAYVPIDDTQCMTTGCTVPARNGWHSGNCSTLAPRPRRR